MQITRLSLWHVPLTSHIPYVMAAGKACVTVETVVVAVETDAGLTGWGEVCPIPRYLPAYARGVAPALTEMWTVIRGVDPVGPEAVMAEVEAHLPGHPYAKSALDIALWDLTAQAADLPLYALLGGRQAQDMPVYESLPCRAPEAMAAQAKAAQQTGVTQFQAKLGAGNDPQADIARLRAVREAVGDGPIVYGDWNCGATALDAIRVGRAVWDLDIMLEQPCATIADCARVADATGLPMKLDEVAHDTATLLEGHARGTMDAVALKLSKFGGLSALRRARDLCLHLGTRMCIECTWGSDVATAASLHLAAATPPERLLNTCDLSYYVAPRLDPTAPTRQNGRIAPPTGPGLGVAPDPAALGQPDLILE